MAKSAFPGPLRVPAKSILALSLLMAFAPGFAATTTTPVPTGTVVTENLPYYLEKVATDTDIFNVLGASSQWNISSDLFVGYSGTGTLNIENGGVVNNTFG